MYGQMTAAVDNSFPIQTMKGTDRQNDGYWQTLTDTDRHWQTLIRFSLTDISEGHWILNLTTANKSQNSKIISVFAHIVTLRILTQAQYSILSKVTWGGISLIMVGSGKGVAVSATFWIQCNSWDPCYLSKLSASCQKCSSSGCFPIREQIKLWAKMATLVSKGR